MPSGQIASIILFWAQVFSGAAAAIFIVQPLYKRWKGAGKVDMTLFLSAHPRWVLGFLVSSIASGIVGLWVVHGSPRPAKPAQCPVAYTPSAPFGRSPVNPQFAHPPAKQPVPRTPLQLERSAPIGKPDGGVTQSGSGNQQTVSQAPITQANSGGCNQQVVGGNNNTNSCAPPARTLLAGDYDEVVTILRPGAPQTVDISAPAGDNEAQNLGVELYKIFKASGWTMKNPIVMSYMKVGGPADTGITVFIHGDPVTAETTLNLSGNDPLLLIKSAFGRENLLYSFQRRIGTPENEIDIEIGVAPLPK